MIGLNFDLNAGCYQMATSNVLVDKMKSEKDVIKDWLENIFKVRADLTLVEMKPGLL